MNGTDPSGSERNERGHGRRRPDKKQEPARSAGRRGMARGNRIRGFLPFAWFPLAVLALHFVLSWGSDAYIRHPRLDILMHLLGGAAIAYFAWKALRHLEDRGTVSAPDRRLLPLMVFALVAAAAVFWEFAEFLSDRFAGTNSQISLANTMRDQFFGLSGGVLYIAWKVVARTGE